MTADHQAIIQDILSRAQSFRREAHLILGLHEQSPSRVILLEQSYNRLSGIRVKQYSLFKEALVCVEFGLFRSAHVMAWAAFMDFLEERLASDNFVKLMNARPNWKIKTIDDLRENYRDFQIIEACHSVNMITKAEQKALQGLLTKRNECAHPSSYLPTLNETLGFVAELINRMESIKARPY